MISPFCGYLAAGPEPEGSGVVDARAARVWASRLDRAPAGRRYHPEEVLDEAVDAGVFRRLERPVLLRYEVSHGAHRVVGVVGVVDAADPALPLLPHEETTPEETSRRRLTRARMAADTRPIVLVTPAPVPDLDPTGPGIEFSTGSGLHRIAVVDSSSAPEVTAAISGHPLVIADGHHRTRVAGEHAGGPGGSILAWVVPAAAVRAGAFHRCFEHAPPLPERVADDFEVVVLDRSRPQPGRGSIVWWPHAGTGAPVRLVPRPGTVAALPGEAAASMSAVARHALWPILSLDERDAVYVSSLDDAVSSVGPGGAAALLPGMAPAEVVAAARAGVLLPPKATRFRPKPGRGVVVRPL